MMLRKISGLALVLALVQSAPAFATDYENFVFSCDVSGTNESIHAPQAAPLPNTLKSSLIVGSIVKQRKVAYVDFAGDLKVALEADQVKGPRIKEKHDSVNHIFKLTPPRFNIAQTRKIVERLGANPTEAAGVRDVCYWDKFKLGTSNRNKANESESRICQVHSKRGAEPMAFHLKLTCRYVTQNR